MSDFDPQITRAGNRHVGNRPAARLQPRRARNVGQRLAVLGAFLVGLLAIAIVVAVSLHAHLPFGLSGHAATVAHRTGGHKRPRVHRPPPAPRASVATVAALLAPASRMAAAPFGTGGALFLGGYDATGAASTSVESFDGSTVQAVATLPAANASAVAASLASSIYLFGGTTSAIYQVSSTGTSVAGDLPTATADAAIASVNGTAYVIGGFDGSAELNAIIAFAPGSQPQVVATLPRPLRLAAAAAAGGQVYIIGGESNGIATSVVYRFDPVSKRITRFARLPVARDREAAATLGKTILVLGGLRTSTSQRTRAIYAIDTSSGRVTLAGLLPKALSDMTAISGQNRVIAAGGVDSTGAATGDVYSVTVSFH